MTPDTRRLLSPFETRGSPPSLHDYYADASLRNRLTSPSVLIPLVLVAISIIYQAAHRLPSLLQLLWDAVLSVVPDRLIFAIDRFMNPSLFPTHMRNQNSPTRAAKDDAARRILGFGSGGGLLGALSRAGLRDFGGRSRASWGPARAACDSPPGLGNSDNSCYQNSILQGLASLKPLPNYLSAISLETRSDLSPTLTVDTLRHLITELSGPCSNGRTLWTPKVLKNMSTWQQQDAQEYYSKLLDQIDTEIARAARALRDTPHLEPESNGYDSPDSQESQSTGDSGYYSFRGHAKHAPEPRLARNPLEGLQVQRVACVNCGYCEGLTMIPFNCLTLTLGSLPEHDLYERLDHYTKVEPIEGVECPKCSLLLCRDLVKRIAQSTGDHPTLRERLQRLEEALEDEKFDEETLTDKCNVTGKMRVSATKTKQVAFARAPPSLVFHVNRSGFDENTGFLFKNTAAVRFPMILDLGPWCLGSAGSRAELGEGDGAGPGVEQWSVNPKASMVSGGYEPPRLTGPIYELRAVITHAGHHENGHYVCYRKHPVSSRPGSGKDAEAADQAQEAGSEEDVADGSMGLDPETQPPSEAGDSDSVSSQNEKSSLWWRLSDGDVMPVDERTVLSQGGVFMLFYDCVDSNLSLVPERGEFGESLGDSPAVVQSPAMEQQEDGVLPVSYDAMALDGGMPPFSGIGIPPETAVPPGSPQTVPQVEKSASEQRATWPAPESLEHLENPKNLSEAQAAPPPMAWDLGAAQDDQEMLDSGEAGGMAEGVLLKVGG
ncbi:hypothetical protein C8A05DRAFT_17708 [Staphylotrichum tortipilum]|uniref:ubiquitinyl hydrolase 1 n=1 Tax=Staphylotrichum tortipilum TaxID=2831512 RepID=A0AAN6RRB0_9PEZI|nr:hypothetical protein C8A05DRAFT_17708 [Staphylotrichum longicolle]